MTYAAIYPTIADVHDKGIFMNSVDIRLRISEEIKKDAEHIFNEMGMTMSQAMRMFLVQCVNTGRLPFNPQAKIPNKDTLESFRQIETGEFESYTLDEFKNLIKEHKNQ